MPNNLAWDSDSFISVRYTANGLFVCSPIGNWTCRCNKKKPKPHGAVFYFVLIWFGLRLPLFRYKEIHTYLEEFRVLSNFNATSLIRDIYSTLHFETYRGRLASNFFNIYIKAFLRHLFTKFSHRYWGLDGAWFLMKFLRSSFVSYSMKLFSKLTKPHNTVFS